MRLLSSVQLVLLNKVGYAAYGTSTTVIVYNNHMCLTRSARDSAL